MAEDAMLVEFASTQLLTALGHKPERTLTAKPQTTSPDIRLRCQQTAHASLSVLGAATAATAVPATQGTSASTRGTVAPGQKLEKTLTAKPQMTGQAIRLRCQPTAHALE